MAYIRNKAIALPVEIHRPPITPFILESVTNMLRCAFPYTDLVELIGVRCKSNTCRIVTIRDNQNIIGCIVLIPAILPLSPSISVIWNSGLTVDKRFRGLGWGRRLVKGLQVCNWWQKRVAMVKRGSLSANMMLRRGDMELARFQTVLIQPEQNIKDYEHDRKALLESLEMYEFMLKSPEKSVFTWDGEICKGSLARLPRFPLLKQWHVIMVNAGNARVIAWFTKRNASTAQVFEVLSTDPSVVWKEILMEVALEICRVSNVKYIELLVSESASSGPLKGFDWKVVAQRALHADPHLVNKVTREHPLCHISFMSVC